MRVKVAGIVMLMVFLGFAGALPGGVTVARAADPSQIYPTLVKQYPNFITQLTSANPGDTQVLPELQSFVTVLSSDLAADQSLTRANFDSEAEADSLAILLSSNAYDDLHKAIAKAFPSLSLSSLINGNIPAFLQPIATVVEDALLPAGTPSPGAGAPPAPQAVPTVAPGLSSISLTADNIGRYVSGGTVDFPAQATPPYFFGLSGGLLAAQGIKGLNVDFGPLALRLDSDLVTDPSTEGEVTIGAVGSTDGSLGAGATSLRGLTPVGQAWNIFFTSENNGQSQTVEPAAPVTLSLDLPSGTASVALYVYDAGNWSYIGGAVQGNTLQAAISGSGEYALMTYAQAFSDVPAGYWAAGDISFMTARHIVQGEGGGIFGPDRPVTRAEFAVMLQKALGIAPSTEPSPFPDATGAWYTGSVTALARAGIVTGDGGCFYPGREITREEMAVMLVRALPQSGLSLGAPVFQDAADISAWAAGDVTEAAQLGLVGGEPGGFFRPRADATRAEAVVMMERLLRLEGKI